LPGRRFAVKRLGYLDAAEIKISKRILQRSAKVIGRLARLGSCLIRFFHTQVLIRKLTLGSRRQRLQSGVWEIVVKNRAKVGTTFRHVSRAALAETEAMSLADTMKRGFPAVFLGREIIARNGIPAESSSDRKTPVFPMEAEQRRIFARDFAGPSNWIVVAKITEHGKIGIAGLRQVYLLGRARAAATTSREHGRDRFFLISKHETMR
jgi:hypothetical protein